jgi:dTDP-4-dehydrorhamnose reductase
MIGKKPNFYLWLYLKINKNMKILLLGSGGLLGSTLLPYLLSMNYDITTHSRTSSAHYNFDLSDSIEISSLIDETKPDIVINLAALTNVDLCEVEPNKAYIQNVHVVENIVESIKKKHPSCYLIHLSTDHVYDDFGLNDEKKVILKNYYSFSKYSSELVALSIPSAILRTNFFGYSNCLNRKSLSDWIYFSLLNNESIKVFDNVQFSPLSMKTLSRMIDIIILEKPNGIFNLGSHKGMSKADFAFTFAEEMKLPTHLISKIKIDSANNIVSYRPKGMLMNISKFENSLNIKLPNLIDEIKFVSKDYYAA